MVTKVQSIKAGSLKKEHFRGYGNEAKPDSAPQEFKLSLHLLLAPICAPQGLCLPSGLLRGEPFSLGQYSHTRRFPHIDMDRNGAFTKFLSFFFFFEASTTHQKEMRFTKCNKPRFLQHTLQMKTYNHRRLFSLSVFSGTIVTTA